MDALGGLTAAIAAAKQLAKIPADSDVQLVVYPAPKSFYDILDRPVERHGDSTAVSAWMSANLGQGEIEALRVMRGPFAIFRRGEPLALMPFTFLRVRIGRAIAADDALERLAVDFDLHPLLRLHHVGAEEAVAAVGEDLVAELVLRRRPLGRRHFLLLDDLDDGGARVGGDRVAHGAFRQLERGVLDRRRVAEIRESARRAR